VESNIILLAILAASILGKANSVAVATCILLIVKLLNMDKYLFPAIEDHGMFLGLILLIAAILIPIANGEITSINIKSVFTSWVGIAALLISLFTTYLSGLGLQYLTVQGHGDIMPALILGAVIAAAFLGGVPVGPLITSGMLALGLKIFHK
jgi:Predicted membrane protein